MWKQSLMATMMVVTITIVATRRRASAFHATFSRTVTKSTLAGAAGPKAFRSLHADANSNCFRFTQQQRVLLFLDTMANAVSGDDSDDYSWEDDASKAEGVTPSSLLELFCEATGKKEVVGNCVADAMYALYNADAVCFDVDSTVISEEGIDALAEYLGKGEEVATMTATTMEGGMKFEDSLKACLDLLKPTRQQILDCMETSKSPLEQLTPGINTLVKSLQSKNVGVFLVSGGFRIQIEPVAVALNISPASNLIANTLLFDEDGTYAGSDATEPTSRDMGKPRALEQIRARDGYSRIVMIGDGVTDAQAKPPATAFIGFGGVVEREPVKEKADWFVTDFSDLTAIVEMRK